MLLRDDSPWKLLDLHRCKTGVKGRGDSLKPKWQANENLIGNPQPLIRRQLQEKQHRALLFLGEDHGAQHLLAWPLI